MKKIYFVPETDVVALNMEQHMLADSDPNVGVDSSKSVDADNLDTRQNHGIGGGLWSDMK